MLIYAQVVRAIMVPRHVPLGHVSSAIRGTLSACYNIESGHAVETKGQVNGLIGHGFRCRILDVNIEYREMCTQDLKIIPRFY